MVEQSELIGVQDEVGAVGLQRQVESLNEQIGLYEKAIDALQKQKVDYLEQCAVDDEAWQIRLAPGNHEKIEDKKSFKYELDPKFWECVRKKQEYEYRDHCARRDSTTNGFDVRIKELEGQLESTREKLVAVEGDVV